MCATAKHYTQTLDGSVEGGREEGEEDGRQENDTWKNESSDWKNKIDCIPSINIYSNGCLSAKYITLWWIPESPEYEPLCPAYIRVTERDQWVPTDNRQRCRGDSGTSGGWWGGPRSRQYQFRIQFCSRYIQQWIWTWMSWGRSQSAACLSYSPINSWPSPWQQVFNSSPAQNQVSGAPGSGNMVQHQEMAMGFRYARSAGGRWNGSWPNFYVSGSSYDMQIADQEGCYGVAAGNYVGEYPWRVGEYGSEWLSWDYRWRMGVVSIGETEFSALPLFRNPDNSTLGASSVDIRRWTNAGGHNARSGSDIQMCHWRVDIWNQCPTGGIVAGGKWE